MTSANAKRGLFITFEGPEGSGKSTQLRGLARRLRAAGYRVHETAEPGGTAIGLQIRRVLLDHKNQELYPTAELLLMFAARAQNVDEAILPALARGEVVVCDRFTDSTLVYQGEARGLGSDMVYDVDRIACRGLVPDLTILVDIDVDTGLGRARRRNERTHDTETRIDEQSLEFHRKVRAAYQKLAQEEAQRIHLVNGARLELDVATEIWAVVEAKLIESNSTK
jgi:dTMP kinase